MRTLAYEAVLFLHARLIARHGGATGLRDEAALRSAVAQPLAGFGGDDLYPAPADKAAALAHAVITNHPFVDGNKRVGHAVLEVLLRLNGLRLDASTDDRERMVLAAAAGAVSRDELRAWVAARVRRVEGG